MSINFRLIFLLLIAYGLMIPLFYFKGLGCLDFWWSMTLIVGLLVVLSFILNPTNIYKYVKDFKTNTFKKILMGLGFAVILFFVFFVGNQISRYILPFAGNQIENVYNLKTQASSLRILILMAFIIGPGEEIFWRGFVQKNLSVKMTALVSVLLSTVFYTCVHLASGNPMLILAALLCGIFWGWLYLRYNSILINIISHTAWDIVVFLLLPFTN